MVLTDGDDERLFKSLLKIEEEKLAKIIVLSSNLQTHSRINQLCLRQTVVYDPIDILFSHKSLHQSYQEIVNQNKLSRAGQVNTSILGALMVKKNMADGMVGGSLTPTAQVIRAGLKVVGLKEGVSTISGAMVMDIPNRHQLYYLADCAVVPKPTSHQLVEITKSTVDTALTLNEKNIKVALLSFSTKGSANHEEVEKVQRATSDLKKQCPEFDIDGEMQLDAAIDPEVARQKISDSSVAGQANVLIFPDLNSGNIVYKAIQRFANATAIGVIVQGFRKPINDLSRGCSSEDIVNLVMVTALQASNYLEKEEG